MNSHIERINKATESIRQEIINHPAYAAITDLEGIRTFMEHHIYAVWDFMSLLKALQIDLTCTTLPWKPVGNPDVRYLINEIVTGEESDIDETGKRMSHFELYLDAMNQSGADTSGMLNLLKNIENGMTLRDAISHNEIPQSAQQFMQFSFDVIDLRKPHITAAVFTFGREDLIPNMFHTIVSDVNQKFPDQIGKFKYYLDRHIEVDGDHHGHLALEMISELCGEDESKWEEALDYSLKALEARSALWNGVLQSITSIAAIQG